MDLETVINDLAEVLKGIDSSAVRFKSSRPPFKEFQPGVGPCPEPQLVKLIAEGLNRIPRYGGVARTRRTPDLLIEKHWAIEIKIARPFGDNGKLAENWSVNLLHPYPGNTSLLGDCLKLIELPSSEQKAVIVVGYEHAPAQVSLEPLLKAFEVVATSVLNIKLGARTGAIRDGLVHPVHQRLMIVGWEVS